MKLTTAFMLELAQLLERHEVSIVSGFIRDTDKTCEVRFMQNGKLFFCTNRGHLTAYDLRTQAGMTYKEANEVYQIRKRLGEQ